MDNNILTKCLRSMVGEDEFEDKAFTRFTEDLEKVNIPSPQKNKMTKSKGITESDDDDNLEFDDTMFTPEEDSLDDEAPVAVIDTDLTDDEIEDGKVDNTKYIGKYICICPVCLNPIFSEKSSGEIYCPVCDMDVEIEAAAGKVVDANEPVEEVTDEPTDEVSDLDGELDKAQDDEDKTESLNKSESVQLKLTNDDMINDIEKIYTSVPDTSEIDSILTKNGANPDSDNWIDGLDVPNAYADIIEWAKKRYPDPEGDIPYDIGKVIYPEIFDENYSKLKTESLVQVIDKEGEWEVVSKDNDSYKLKNTKTGEELTANKDTVLDLDGNKLAESDKLKEAYYAVLEVDGVERRYSFNDRDQARKFIDSAEDLPQFRGHTIGSKYTESVNIEVCPEGSVTVTADDTTVKVAPSEDNAEAVPAEPVAEIAPVEEPEVADKSDALAGDVAVDVDEIVSVDDFDNESFDKLVSENLSSILGDGAKFESTKVIRRNNGLVIEGLANGNKVRFICNESKSKKNVFRLEGLKDVVGRVFAESTYDKESKSLKIESMTHKFLSKVEGKVRVVSNI